MGRIHALLVIISLCLSIGVCEQAFAQTVTKPLSVETVKILSGDWHYYTEIRSVNGKLFESFASTFDTRFINGQGDPPIFDIRGWDYLIAFIGVDDKGGKEGVFSIEVDGNLVKQVAVRKGEDASKIVIPLTGHQTMKLNDAGDSCAFNPVLIKGTPPGQTPITQQTITTQPTINQPATFVVDPNDLDKLALALRKRVDAKPEIQQKLTKGFLAVMTFDLVDIPSTSVGKNVAEDLSTSLINNDFQLVERGQLDKALKELKIQDSALIDQATALKLGQITGCNYIIVGSVSDRGQFMVINARFLETATGKAVAAERVECRKIEIKR